MATPTASMATRSVEARKAFPLASVPFAGPPSTKASIPSRTIIAGLNGWLISAIIFLPFGEPCISRHVIKSMGGWWARRRRQASGHGEDPQGPMCLETARIDQALGFEDRPCNTKAVRPVALLGLAQDPILFVSRSKSTILTFNFFQQGEDTFLLHYSRLGRRLRSPRVIEVAPISRALLRAP